MNEDDPDRYRCAFLVYDLDAASGRWGPIDRCDDLDTEVADDGKLYCSRHREAA